MNICDNIEDVYLEIFEKENKILTIKLIDVNGIIAMEYDYDASIKFSLPEAIYLAERFGLRVINVQK